MDYLEAVEILGGKMSVAEAATLAMEGRQEDYNTTVERAIWLFLKSCREDELRDGTIEFYNAKLALFRDKFEDAILAKVSKGQIMDFLQGFESLGNRSAVFRAVRRLYSWSSEQEPPLIPDNPTKTIKVKDPRKRSKNFLTIEQATNILRNIEPHLQNAAAIQLFAGVRPEEVRGPGKPPMTGALINFKEKIIRVPEEISKTEKTRILENLPDVIWDWLTPIPPDKPISPIKSVALMRRMQIAGGFLAYSKGRLHRLNEWPYDGTRHTFATYDVAAYQHPGRTSLIIGHEGGLSLLHRTYRGLVTQAEGLTYMALTRAVVLAETN